MRFNTDLVLASLAGMVAASQASSILPRQTEKDACAEIHQRFTSHNGSKTNPVFMPGTLGLQCLNQLPFDSKRAVKFVREYRKWLEFQSDIELLKNPPPSYQMPATDLLGGLDKILANAAAKVYTSQFEFDTAIYDLVGTAFDGHLSIKPCSFNVLGFRNELPLVSVSSNGTALPEVYTFNDAQQLQAGNKKVSPIVSINGVDVQSYLKTMSLRSNSQDWDALYNQLFYSDPLSIFTAGESGQSLGIFASSLTWPGAQQTLSFANSSTQTANTHIRIKTWPWKNSTEVYTDNCIPAPVSASSSSSSSGSSTVETATPLKSQPSGYPQPFLRDDYNRILGYFPESDHLQDVGVLVLPTFSLTGKMGDGKLPNDEIEDVSDLARQFIGNATEKGKKKIIIDLQGNGGGTIMSGQNLFRLFFPKTDIDSAARFRAHKGADLLGQALSNLPYYDQALLATIFNYQIMVTPNQQSSFDSWEDYFGPHAILGMNSSSLLASNFSLESTPSSPINGYGSVPANPSKASFAAEDIILITDGICASTCTLFTELMKAQGVRTIAFGGRPLNGPMQGMGGVKGAEVLEIASYGPAVKEAKKQALKSQNTSQPLLSKADLADWDQYVPIPLSDFPFRLSTASVNLLNAFSRDNTMIPRQFLYEAAECHRFYTVDNVFRPESTWASAAQAMFDGGGCVPGSTNATGSLYSKEPANIEALVDVVAEKEFAVNSV
ncbi:uncharacterized protein N7459_002621 [Penicillium hispanicum]|uniref:uncharacterized protein n=1 Tax=Penicillium hispanicum TaxID=1080232 RepID=UPI00254196EC|nr:uncharacterized protein N7459_002621 [Penicillium hispanicum]KAJ5586856.1 hypothetical protein N7459_002621 [Penicillium hispanicum]